MKEKSRVEFKTLYVGSHCVVPLEEKSYFVTLEEDVQRSKSIAVKQAELAHWTAKRRRNFTVACILDVVAFTVIVSLLNGFGFITGLQGLVVVAVGSVAMGMLVTVGFNAREELLKNQLKLNVDAALFTRTQAAPYAIPLFEAIERHNESLDAAEEGVRVQDALDAVNGESQGDALYQQLFMALRQNALELRALVDTYYTLRKVPQNAAETFEQFFDQKDFPLTTEPQGIEDRLAAIKILALSALETMPRADTVTR